MTQRDNILQELKELGSTLPAPQPKTGYQVPEGYFDALAGSVLNRIRASEAAGAREETALLSATLNTVSREMPFTVPAGYFDSLPEEALRASKAANAGTAQEELEALSPLLGKLKKETPYSIPAGYFEKEVAVPAAQHAGGRVISLTHRPWFRIAAAAVITGIILLAGWLILGYNNSPEKRMARMEKKLNKELTKMSDQELNDFVSYTDPEAGLGEMENVSASATDEVKNMLQDISDKELRDFLEETSDATTAPESSTMN